MDTEDKELLLKDLCARLPYSVKCYIEFEDSKVFPERTLMPVMIQDFKEHEFVIFKPYLRLQKRKDNLWILTTQNFMVSFLMRKTLVEQLIGHYPMA